MTWLSKTSAMPLTAARRSSVHIVVFRAEHESLSSRCRDTRGTMRGDGGETDGQTSNAGLGFDRPKAARSSPSSALLA
jgi:hypothetical protein